jgi:Ca2+-binding EF-hand superfamily protein
MRSHILMLMLAMLPATTAAAQFAGKKPGDAPAADAKAVDGGEQGALAAGPTANAMFAAIDVDGDGVITKVELRKAIKALMTLDADKDGNITLAEASSGNSPNGAPIGPGGDAAQFVERMMQFDKNRDGMLTANEVPANMRPMLQNADKNNDNAIDQGELVAALANIGNQFPGALGGRGVDAQQVTGQFLQYDRNRDGRLTQNEVPPQAMQMLQGGDQNNDGAIDAGELQAVIAGLGDRARAWQAGAGPNGERMPGRGNAERARKRDKEEN